MFIPPLALLLLILFPPLAWGSDVSVSIVLENWGKLLLIAHTLLGILLLGTITHNALITWRYLKGDFRRINLEKLYVKVAAVAYGLTFTLGAVLYPNYRYYVRALYFDQELPWASHLFDIKEHWAGIGLGLMVAFYLMSRTIQPRSDRRALFFYVFLSLSLAVIVWFTLISGLYLTSLRSV